MRSEKLEKFILEHDAELNHFCEVGVYEYNYCRLIKQIEAGKRVTLFECFPRCIEDIVKNTKERTNVVLHPVAIFDKAGEFEMTDVGASAFLSDLGEVTPAHKNGYAHTNFGKFSVKADIFSNYDDGSIDALFVDTEGAEWFVLKYMTSRPRVIEIETHYNKYENRYMKEILDWMAANNYTQLDRTDADTIFIKQ